MVQLIMGLKGSGKTKRLVEMVATAVREESGSVVCIEKDKKLTYDIPYQARLIYACDYAYAMALTISSRASSAAFMPATTISPMCLLTTSRKCSLRSLSRRLRSSWPG